MDIVERLELIQEAVMVADAVFRTLEGDGEIEAVRYVMAHAPTGEAVDAFTIRVKCENCRGRGTIGSGVLNGPSRCPMSCVDGYIETGLIETVAEMQAKVRAWDQIWEVTTDSKGIRKVWIGAGFIELDDILKEELDRQMPEKESEHEGLA